MDAEYILAWVVPLFAGAGVWRLAAGAGTSRGDGAATLGAGWLIGILLAGLLAPFCATDATRETFARTAPWLVLVGVVAWVVTAFRAWRHRGTRVDQTADSPDMLVRIVFGLLVALIAVRVGLLAWEASLRPLFPWDAWSTWAFKAKTWFGLGHAEAWVPMKEWLAGRHATALTMPASAYPDLLAWIELWFASAAHAFEGPRIALAWSGALVAFAFAAYGYWRAAGHAALAALALVYALISLPLLDAHVALAGYADLWVALVLGLAALAWMRFIETGATGQLLLCAGLALVLPMIKLEGAFWLLALAVVILLERLPRRSRWPFALAAVGLIVIGLVMGGFELPLPELGLVRIHWGLVDIPALGRYPLAFHPVGQEILAGLFTLPNWHLLWYLAPLVAIVRWRVFGRVPAARFLGLALLLFLAFLAVLFFFTGAAAWARDYTSANRLVLQIVPAMVVLLALLLRPDSSVPASDRSELRKARGNPDPADFDQGSTGLS